MRRLSGVGEGWGAGAGRLFYNQMRNESTAKPLRESMRSERSIQLVGIERKPKRARSPWLLQVASAAEVASALVAQGRLDRV